MKTNFLMPEKAHPINNLEQRMVELNIMLYENFGSFENIFTLLQKMYEDLPEGSEKVKLLNLILHFRCLNQITSGGPEFLEIIDERNSYKNGFLP
ncbi:hypothetical protein ACFQO9_04470 [Chryseobacterium zhengzhouense]|uniref:Uncharacterized protein n=1 Tax=Chryseobacterium zhengzhouense TaxID=1636086 RepID=A0ABW2LWS0_9FLAO